MLFYSVDETDFYYFFNLVVKASPPTKIFFLLIPTGKAKISTIDKKKIISSGNLPIPHSEKAKANDAICIFLFLVPEIYMIYKNLNTFSAKIIEGVRVLEINSKINFSHIYEIYC